MHDQRVCIEWPAGLAVLPRLTAIQAAHQCAGFDGGEETTGNQGVGRNPADMARVWPWWKAPGRGRGQLAQCGQLPPRVAAVLGAKERAWLGARVDHARATGTFGCTDGYSHYLLVGDALTGMLPRVARVATAPQPLIEGAAID